MKKFFLVFISLFIFTAFSYGQADEGSRKKGKNDQDALDETMVSPEQKKQMKEQAKVAKKAKKAKDAKDKITRKRAEKISRARLKKAGSKTSKKKKRYVKTH